jgi:hypothetical protein
MNTWEEDSRSGLEGWREAICEPLTLGTGRRPILQEKQTGQNKEVQEKQTRQKKEVRENRRVKLRANGLTRPA